MGFSLYSGYWQVVVTGVIALCGPGMFNALTGLGNAGGDSNAASFVNFCLYSSFAIFGYTGGLFFNYLGPRLLMGTGALTYALYATFAYLAGVSGSWASSAWIASGFLLGIGAAFLWTAQGALMMAYAPENRKGHYIGLFWTLFNVGGVMGGLLTFGINFDNASAQTANPTSYFVFVGMMCLGSLLAFLLLVSPDKVTREDGVRVSLPALKTFREELRDVASVILDRNMMLLAVLFFSSNYFYTYVFNVNAALFNVRTRGLNSALFFGMQMLGAVSFGLLVDSRPDTHSVFARGRRGFLFVAVSMTFAWAVGIYLQYGYQGGYDTLSQVKIDFTEAVYAFPCLVYCAYGWSDSIIQTFAYWLMSVIARDDARLAGRYAGYYKGVQSVGAAVAWLLDSSYVGMAPQAQLWVCVGLFVVGMALSWLVVAGLRHDTHDEPKVETKLSRDSEAQPVMLV
jgi:hypothetical protein